MNNVTDSTINMPDEVKMELKEEIEKKAKMIMGDMSEDVDPTSKNVQVPETMVLSENPLFDTYKDGRSSK